MNTRSEKLKLLIPIDEIESTAIDQIKNVLDLPFLNTLAIMPDVHAGYSLPIGGVALLENVISPAFVGYDIGCGMCFIETSILKHEISDQPFLNDLYTKISTTIPNGEGKERKQAISYKPYLNSNNDKSLFNTVQSKIEKQIGTLGGGNHFIELGISDNSNRLCITIHSGSRNPGHSVCDYYERLSKEVDKHLPDGFLDLNSDYGKAYISDMNFMLEFALKNRELMMRDILSILRYNDSEINDYISHKMINENHNHAVVDYNTNMVLHRKGSTPANKHQYGIIPGNMRDGVYITIGLGNKEYLSSTSHGSGRVMSRKKAKQELNYDEFVEQMKNVVSSKDISLLDEAPNAYKDINRVIELQRGIVINVVDHITPIINIKGIGSTKPWERKKETGDKNE